MPSLIRARLAISKLLFTCLFLSTCFSAKALSETDDQFWTAATVTGGLRLGSKWRYYGEFQPRLGNDWQTWERLIARGALGYKLESGLTLWGGYGYMPSLVDNKFHHDYSPESRIWQMATYNHKVDTTEISHRGILEQRFIDKAANEVAHRLRYRLKISEPLMTIGKETIFGWSVSDELMINANSVESGPQTGFDRNRLSTGPYLQRGTWRGDLGYMWEASDRPGSRDRELHVLVLSTSWSFN